MVARSLSVFALAKPCETDRTSFLNQVMSRENLRKLMYLDFGPHFARLSGYPYAQAETCELDDISLNGFSDAYIQRCRLISGFYGTKT